jgi:hypothetical protein
MDRVSSVLERRGKGLYFWSDMRASKGFVKRLPTRAKPPTTPSATVIEANILDAVTWHELVQPYIDADESRLDRGWDWVKFLLLAELVEEIFGRQVTYVQIVCPAPGTETLIPIAQMIMSSGYPFVAERTERPEFVWWLTTAPETFLVNHGIQPLSALKGLIDTAIQLSAIEGFEGRIGLHADPLGGADLLEKYAHAGLKRLGRFWPVIVGNARRNDGRYFYSDSELSLKLSDRLDFLR